MSIFHCQAKAISRAAGRSATAAAAYRAGERITDERTGEIHDYRKKKGVIDKQIFVPRGCRGIARPALWNLAEKAENRKDAKVAREWEVALPAELKAHERRDVAREFALALVKRYGVAVDMCIHASGKKGDDRNHHAHILTTTRVLTPDGFGGKIRILDSPRTSGKEVAVVRELWARMCNDAFARNGLDEHIDSRTLKAQGIDREPTRHLGPTASAMERHGVKTFRGDENRRRRGSGIEKELGAWRKIENGIEAARLRHERRKYRAEWEAKRLKREKEAQRFAEEQSRAANRKGMQR
jgi:ATP-dependent exoDNAse (exonuclease V) alpha subunit